MNKELLEKAMLAKTQRTIKKMRRYQQEQWAIGNYEVDYKKFYAPTVYNNTTTDYLSQQI